MKLKNNFLSLLCLSALPLTAQAVTVPKCASRDCYIQQAVYNPNEVIHIRGKIGNASWIQLEPDERLVGDSSFLGLGDKKAWNLGIKGNNIVFKPTAKLPDTNLLVQTNKRSYAFSLSLKPVKNQKPTYILRFIYPDSKAAQSRALADKQAKALDKLYRAGKLKNAVHNQNYWAFGDKALAPTAAYDNGRFTYLSFDNGKELPMVYKVMDDGSEALLNTHMENDVIVIHETAKKFVLRLGKSVLAIENRAFNEQGTFNRTGTDSNDNVRINR